MKIHANHISNEEKWAMSAKGLTGALAAHLNAMYDSLGRELFEKTIRHIWAEIGKATALEMKAHGVPTDTVEAVAMAGVTSCLCAMGPEYHIEQVTRSEKRTVMKISQCPWQNRMKESGISRDLLSACDVAFWQNFTRHLNPDVTMRHGKQMHRGDSHCEWIFEARSPNVG